MVRGSFLFLSDTSLAPSPRPQRVLAWPDMAAAGRTGRGNPSPASPRTVRPEPGPTLPRAREPSSRRPCQPQAWCMAVSLEPAVAASSTAAPPLRQPRRPWIPWNVTAASEISSRDRLPRDVSFTCCATQRRGFHFPPRSEAHYCAASTAPCVAVRPSRWPQWPRARPVPRSTTAEEDIFLF